MGPKNAVYTFNLYLKIYRQSYSVFPLVVSTWQYKSTFKEKYTLMLKRREEKEEEGEVNIFFNA